MKKCGLAASARNTHPWQWVNGQALVFFAVRARIASVCQVIVAEPGGDLAADFLGIAQLLGNSSLFVVPPLGGIRQTFRLKAGLRTQRIGVSSRHGQTSLLWLGLDGFGLPAVGHRAAAFQCGADRPLPVR